MTRVRPAVMDDYPALLELERQLLSVHATELPEAFHLDGSDLSKRYFARLISHPWSRVLVAEVDGVSVAYAVLRVQTSGLAEEVMARLPAKALPIAESVHRLWSRLRSRKHQGLIAERRVVFVDWAVVSSEYRRQKVTATMLDAAVQWSLERGAEDLQFEVYEFNQPMHRFAEYAGLKLVKRRYSRPLSDGGEARVDDSARTPS